MKVLQIILLAFMLLIIFPIVIVFGLIDLIGLVLLTVSNWILEGIRDLVNEAKNELTKD